MTDPVPDQFETRIWQNSQQWPYKIPLIIVVLALIFAFAARFYL